MFEINKDQTIRINSGNSIGPTPLIINQSAQYGKNIFKFESNVSIIRTSKELGEVVWDDDYFFNLRLPEAQYDFEYNYLYTDNGEKIGDLGWYLNQQPVDISLYGINYTGAPKVFSHIILNYYPTKFDEVQFLIFDTELGFDKPILCKKFRSDNKTSTEFMGKPVLSSRNQIVFKDKLYINLLGEETALLAPGRYKYTVTAKWWNNSYTQYTTHTLIPMMPFYVSSSCNCMC